MKKLLISDLDDVALGATILGSGGGGDPAYDLLMAKQQLEECGLVEIVDISDVADDAFVVPVGFIGAPLVGIERLPSGREFPELLRVLEKMHGRPITHLLAAEIGGSNAFAPLIAASQAGLPVIDGDTLGRAFPELQMSSCNLKGISPSPAALIDGLGNTVVICTKNGADVERFCRKVTVEMGSSAALSVYLMNGQEARGAIIPGSLTRALQIGRSMRYARERREDPIEALLACTGGVRIGSGTITDIDQTIEDGFLKGSCTVSGSGQPLKVYYQNEYLMLYRGDQPVVATPDIIIPLEQESGQPMTSESLIYGVRVVLVGIPGPDIWKTDEGLALVGPHYFGYDVDYESINIKKENTLCQKNM